jgi:DNA-binding NarL/FixJ family response regulator
MIDEAFISRPMSRDEEAQTLPPISLVVIDDNRMLREAMCEMLRRHPGFTVHAAAAALSVDQQLALAARVGERAASTPTVVLLDESLGDHDSIRACAGLREGRPALHVIVMGMIAQHEEVADFVNAGAAGFIMKDASPEAFVSTIRHVAQGERSLPRALTHSLFAQIISEWDKVVPTVLEESVRLTVREREIMKLLGEGLSNRDIATRLHIAIHTVKSHVHNILEKLSLRTRLEVAAYSRLPGSSR